MSCRSHAVSRSLAGLAVLALILLRGVGAQTPTWIARGPGPIMPGQVATTDREVVGAINALATHPTNADILYVGAVNGGIWKTTNATAASPTWTSLTDFNESLSISALELDPSDATNQTLVAGIGGYSSFGDRGPLTGLLRTTDGGATWTPIDCAGVLDGLNISGVAPRGAVIVLSASFATPNTAKQGVWRSTDAGATCTQISGTGLPAGRSLDLAGDPTNPARLFTHFGSTGLYRSTDLGATWTKVSDAAMDGQLATAWNVEIAVGWSNNVSVAFVQAYGIGAALSGIFRSGDGGATWAAMDLPGGSQTAIHPGLQGGLHLSIAADPTNAYIVYIGGDYGPRYRGDVSQPAGSQFVRLSGVGGTINNTTPHADTRDLKFAANGDLIEVDDGGIYRRNNPQTSNGNWSSLNGNLQVTEFHSVAWDTNAKILLGGTQDNDTPQQTLPAGTRWGNVSSGDGGVVAVDASTTAGYSIRFVSAQYLLAFQRRLYDQSNTLISAETPALMPLDGAADIVAQFYTPLRLNNVDPQRMILGGDNGVYESTDHGANIRAIAPGVRINAFGRHAIGYGATGNPDMLYVGASTQVLVRSGPHPASLIASPTYAGGLVRGIAIDPGNPQTAFVVGGAGASTTRVYRTTGAGATWTNITGNLTALAPGLLRTIAYVSSTANGAVVVGADAGVFTANGPAFTTWSLLSTGLPRAPVFQLEYAKQDDMLLAGTLGRGAWTLDLATQPQTTPWTDDGTVVRLTTATDLVGIGTALPGGKLHVDVDGDGGGDLFVEDAGANKGNAGIGTTNPGYSLTVGDATALPPASRVQLNAANSAGVLFNGGVAAGAIIYDYAQNHLRFETSTVGPTPTERMRITGDGNVGIGTTNPGTARLAVAGNTSVTGNITATGNFTANGNAGIGAANTGTSRLAVAGNTSVTGNITATGNFTADGNAGIGAANTGTSRLAVAGDVELTASSPTLKLAASAEQPATIRFFDLQALTTQRFDIAFSAADEDLHFRSDEKEMMTLTNDGIIFFTPKNLHTTHPSLVGSQFAIGWNSTGGRGETDFYQHGGGGWRAGYDFYSQRDGQAPRLLASLRDNGNLLLLGSVGSLSDARYKVNVRPIVNPVSKIMSLRGVSFNWNPGEGRDGDDHLGLIAQEVRNVVPEVVLGGPNQHGQDEPYSLSYDRLVPVLIEALKEQQRVIDSLSRRVSQLETRVGRQRRGQGSSP